MKTLNAHMSYSDRQIIEKAIYNDSNKKSIADAVGKDPSTIAKEIRLHRFKSYSCSLILECSNYKKCKHDRRCNSKCLDYVPFKCKRRDVSPGACNGCSNFKSCRFSKYKYDASIAQNEYEKLLIESRQGFNITKDEIKRIGEIVEPLLKQGQSPYEILNNHPEIDISEKTLYTYIESGLFKTVDIDLGPLDLRRQVNRKITKDKAVLYKPRHDFSYLKGRKYEDCLAYIEVNPDATIVQSDTVYNDINKGPFVQTFKFIKYGFQLYLFHKEKTAQEMNDGVLLLETILGEELFNEEVNILLVDRGSEFYSMPNIESRDDGTIRTRLYYCDPMMSCQKGSCENMHTELRYILPKETDLYALGLNNQDDMNLVTSHINSAPKEKLNGKSPFELMEFLNQPLFKKFLDFGIAKIDKDKVILKPYLLKK